MHFSIYQFKTLACFLKSDKIRGHHLTASDKEPAPNKNGNKSMIMKSIQLQVDLQKYPLELTYSFNGRGLFQLTLNTVL